MALQRLPGELVARGTRSSIRAYGRGAVVKIPHPSTPDGWIEWEAQYADDVRAVGAPVPRLLGIERLSRSMLRSSAHSTSSPLRRARRISATVTFIRAMSS